MTNENVEQHRAAAPKVISCAVITVSDTRTLETDTGGRELVTRLEASGHTVTLRKIVPDEPEVITTLVMELVRSPNVEAILITGGTGISSRDRTYEAVKSLLTQELPGYGELFRWLSFQEIGPAAMLSRAIGGVATGKVLLTMPGSPAAVRLAMERLILPELGHLVREATK